ncbi:MULTISPECIES: hypothetical protein [Providencia]|uniref:Lipoprotein n=1 Tax=Providencia heimbachae ATCC 35613 TaxID=1354272 RepID=A0A1B7JSY4_9GAMM|nr:MULTISPECIES: hypothetical protein [Providencia]MBP6122407.1 hypothetical protein [Providencia sp.]NIH20940.1 hypothetical protein [Providencia heimbachae]OAT51007.1 hypothetical protein M998_2346 [Providencia heimbachae ATCC 35613]SQH11574.1 Uncharacterised protein [Providencia heimbachae]
MKFPYPKLVLAPLFSVVFLSGCAQGEVFSPPVNSENIHFTATIPDELEAQPLSAMYRSEICRKERRNSSMESYTVPGFHRESYPLSVRQLNQVEVNIPKEGGGKCDWKLSNIKFEVKLKDPSKIDALISKNFGAEATFVIDNNAPQVFDGGFEKKSGSVDETLILFPLISELFIDGHVKQFWLIAKYETLTYKLKNAQNINLIIDYKSDMKSYWISVKKKEDGAMATLIYPNGDTEKTREIKPEYQKLMQILEAQGAK